MRTFGIGIFDNDRALSVRDEFAALLAQGHSGYVASDKLIEKYGHEHETELYLALAELQLAQGIIQPKVKKHALTLIITGEAAEDWESAGSAVFENRKTLLQDLRRRLLAMPT